MEKLDKLLSLDDVAELLSICRRGVYRLIAVGELPQPVKVGRAARMPVSDVSAYMERLKQGRRR